MPAYPNSGAQQRSNGVMTPTSRQSEAFLSGEALPGVKVRLNDPVHVVGESKSDEKGFVISGEDLGADPLIRVELESTGRDVIVRQSRLRVLVDEQ